VNLRPVAAALLTAVTLTACVSQVPMTLSERFSDPHTRPATPQRPSRNAPPCPLIVSTITDSRTDPALLGRVSGRPVRAPVDVNAWLRNVVAGLASRGVIPSFDVGSSLQTQPLVADLSLRMAWVSEIQTSKTATMLLHMKLSRGESVLSERDYRGSDTLINWSSGDGELQRMVDRALGNALDQIADEVGAACRRSS
jgi:hypothetical protein